MPMKIHAAMLLAAAMLGACSGTYSGTPQASAGGSGTPTGGGAGSTFASDKDFFTARVQPNLGFCRTCHVPQGVADTDTGKLMMLSPDPAQDYANLQASWIALAKGVDSNLILQNPSGAHAHSGGAPWPSTSASYAAMKLLLSCWDQPSGCAALLAAATSGSDPAPLPLLENPGKHYFVSQICDGQPDSTPIDWARDPRRFMSGANIDNDNYAVYFNDPFEICHNDTLIQNQASENALLTAASKTPIHTAKPYAATCGEWRARVKEGHDWIAYSPTDTPREGGQGNGAFGVTDYSAQAWNKLWVVWGMSARPDNFDDQVIERYGHSPTPARPGSASGSYDHDYPNPYPVIDAARGIDETTKLTKTFGGTGHLPLGFAQGRDANGVYNGKLSLNCFSCHAGQVGSGEIASRDGINDSESYGGNPAGSFMGLPNTNTELGVLIIDLIHAQQPVNLHIPPVGYLPLVNTTRGTNAADTEIEAIVAIRDFDTLNFDHAFVDPVHASFGDQDPPAWWWLHNKSRYLWFGGHSTDSSRGNMYFGSVNGLSGDDVKRNEGIFESVHDWSLTVEAPDYPQGYCSGTDGSAVAGDKPGCINRALAEQGAILFHEKNLWADGQNADIPKPHGNGACASCHGAYAPRYASDPRFLPDPKMIGETGYTVPIEIINTDPAQATGWSAEIRPFVSTFWWSYPDATPDYRFPESKDPLTEFLDDYSGYVDGLSNGPAMADHLDRYLDGMGLLQPLGDVLQTVLGATLPNFPPVPLGATVGRVKGACGFEEKTIGYVTPPLHGVWASGPYFHNGSVPTVWDVLKPSDRPAVWRRQRTSTSVEVNAFEHRLSGYDFDHLGWKYDTLTCGDGGQGIPYYTCEPGTPLPPEIDWIKTTLDGGLIWPTWVVPPPFGDAGLADRMIYNTNLYSKKNSGHQWTQVLTDNERKALLEYLKTL
ncbi:MAG TPA: hypothetical protein VHE37_00430 [Nevskiaceae bacterium]|nr:hypothetical protein [Nevskiaceae bacterium]